MSGQMPLPGDAPDSAGELELARAFERIESRERHARRNAIAYSAVPVALAVALVAFSGYWIRRSARDVQALRVEKTKIESDVRRLRDENGVLNEQKRELEVRLSEATEMVKYERPVDLEDAKYVASSNPGAGRILERVLELRRRGVRWHLGGRTPAVGFDSPSFAVFILLDLGLIGSHSAAPDSSPAAEIWRSDPGSWLRTKLPEVAEPRAGDLVLYSSGYAMFYFEKPGRQPFVIGMTPFGITALKPDFAKRFGVRRVAG